VKGLGLTGPRYARLSETMIQKHKHHMLGRCLCFWIIVSLRRRPQAALGRRPASPQRDSPVFVTFVPFVLFVFAVSPCSVREGDASIILCG
jgi:hypothetical protein